tara:strand:- start:267 stop:848 length:582 start_codon:yes stop_codon:yes gene_type:complete
MWTRIFYHVWWPGQGNDPMYLANISMNRDRNNYYGNNYTPHMYTNGKDSGSNTNNWKNDPRTYLNEVGLYEILIDGTQSGNSIDFNVTSSSISNSSSDIRLYVATVMGHVKYSKSPNGLTDHHDAVIEILTGNSGKKMNYIAADKRVDSFSWSMPKNWIDHPSINWNSNDIKVVAWIQNYNSKEILQVFEYEF